MTATLPSRPYAPLLSDADDDAPDFDHGYAHDAPVSLRPPTVDENVAATEAYIRQLQEAYPDAD